MNALSPEQAGGVEREQVNRAMAPEMAQELSGIAVETNRRAEAWTEYAGYGDEYTRRNDERVAAGTAKIDKFGDGSLTLIASINTEKIDPATGEAAKDPNAPGLVEGGAVDLHDFNPESRNHSDIESAYNEYLAATSPEERLVVFEGDAREQKYIADRSTAIGSASESGLMQFLAARDGVEAVTGEPSDADIASFVESRGVRREELVLVLMIRNLTHEASAPLPEDITMQIYGEAVVNGVEGFQDIPDSEKQRIIQQNPEILSALRNQARGLAERLNADLAELGLPELQLREDGTIGFSSMGDRAVLAKAWDPRSEGRLAEIHTMMTEARDHHIFTTVADAIQEGKKPFVVYGGSHVMSLEPTFESYFDGKPS